MGDDGATNQISLPGGPKYRWLRWPVLVAATGTAICSLCAFLIYLWAAVDLGLEREYERWLNLLAIIFLFSSGAAIAMLAWIVRDFLRRTNDSDQFDKSNAHDHR